jgi:hypothetical protein
MFGISDGEFFESSKKIRCIWVRHGMAPAFGQVNRHLGLDAMVNE